MLVAVPCQATTMQGITQDVVQVAPLTMNEVGLGLLPVKEPLKPGLELTAAPAGTWPL